MITPNSSTSRDPLHESGFTFRALRLLRIPRLWRRLAVWGAASFIISCLAGLARANSPGGIIPNSPNVTVVDNGDETVTISNSIVAITLYKNSNEINSVRYTFTSGGQSHTVETLLKGSRGREQYYFGGVQVMGSGHPVTYSLAVDPASNGGDYGEITLTSDPTATNGVSETHYSMLRGSPGFYTTHIQMHRSQDAAGGETAFGVTSRVPDEFNWVSDDAARSLFVPRNPVGMTTHATATLGILGAAHEMGVNSHGYGDKFDWAVDHGDLKAFGISCVTPGGLNYGRWMMTNLEFSNGGPLKRDVFAYGNNLNNSILTGELGQGGDGNFGAGEIWTKVTGPFFNYLDHLDANDPRAADRSSAANALFSDANAQDVAEKAAWPYSWFVNPNYASSSQRGTVSGKLVISDPANRNPLVAGTVVGLIKQPITTHGVYDFTKWFKPYQYFTTTDAEGNYTFKNVRADTGYTLWAYGPGVPGTFQSQRQTGGDAPIELTLPSPTQSIDVTGGSTITVPTMTWNVKRVGNTVFEIGVPDRKADEFRHGEDFWMSDLAPTSGGANPAQRFPDGIWGAPVLYGYEFPNGVVYNVGTSRWSTDWNYILPTLPGPATVPTPRGTPFSTYVPARAIIHFNLATAPSAGAQASLFLGIATSYGANITISVNGVSLCKNAKVTSAPTDVSAVETFKPVYEDDSGTHMSNHGPYCDERFTFPGSFLQAGDNTITLGLDTPGPQVNLMLDYLRFELAGYMPPPPSSVRVFGGNNCNLVTWPVVPGATHYAIWRSSTAGSGYTSLASAYPGAVSGADASMMTFADTGAVNNTHYYYVVQSLNSTGPSAYSPEANCTPQSTKPSSAPITPAEVHITASGHHNVALSWTACPGADYYQVYRTTLVDDRAGHYNVMRKIMLTDMLLSPATSFTDTTPTDGRPYAYSVIAVNAAGSSAESTEARVMPLPTLPGPVQSLASKRTVMARKPGITLTWAAPSEGDAPTGYAIYYSMSPDGPFEWPYQYVGTTTGLTALVTSLNNTPTGTGRNAGPEKVPVDRKQTYYFQVYAVNVRGASTPVAVTSSP